MAPRLGTRIFTGALALAAAPAVFAADPGFESRARSGVHPRLAVVVSVDQLRADALTRYADLFLPPRDEAGRVGGFRWLMTEGNWFLDSRFSHVPNETGPGHSVLLTGADPFATGIVGNQWWDRGSGRLVYCVEDPRGEPVGVEKSKAARSIGPVNLGVTTVGDELEMATAGRAKTVSIAMKDRAAVLMAGHAADLVLWLDTARLEWMTSRAYLPEGELPPWVDSEAVSGLLRDPAGRTWKPLPETVRAVEEGRARSLALPGWKGPLGMGVSFPHRVPDGEEAASGFLRTPDGDDAVFAAGREAVRRLEMGKDDVPDLLTLGLSANDWIGHAWGPYSPESLDALLRADRGLANFLRFLAAEVPGGLDSVVIVVTTDHGIATPPEDLAAFGIEGRRVPAPALSDAAEAALDKELGEGTWVAAYIQPYLWFTAEARKRAPSPTALESVAARAIAEVPGVYDVYGRTAIVGGRLPDTPVARAVSRGFHPSRGGDLVVVMDPFVTTDLRSATVSPEFPYPADHSQAWSYDAEVPVLLGGFGLPAGVRTQRVGPGSIAPTLSILLGVARPSGSDAPLLY